MTRADYVAVCRQCKNRAFDANLGVICGLTNKIADFNGECSGFVKDEIVEQVRVTDPDEELDINHVGVDVKDKLRLDQNFNYALIGGVIAMLVSAIGWAMISVTAKVQIGYMGIAVGMITGLAVRFFGAGIDKKFQFLGAVLALLGCMLGNLLTQIGFTATSEDYPFLYVLSFIDIYNIWGVMVESFQPLDLLFYGFAISFGFRFSAIRVTPALVEGIKNGTGSLYENRNRYRLPLAITGMVIILLVVYVVSSGYSGPLSEKNESGQVTATGEFKHGKLSGHWTFYYPTGRIQNEGDYLKGRATGVWKYYNEDGTLSAVAVFNNGMEHGPFVNYYPNGQMLDSCGYIYGRVDGVYKSWYESGLLSTILHKKRDVTIGEMRLWYENGQLMSVFNCTEDTTYMTEHYSKAGEQLVKAGNGIIRNYYEDGKPESEYSIVNGIKHGAYKDYYPDGLPKSVGEYVKEQFRLYNFWSPDGTQMVVNGNGKLNSYDDDSTLTEQTYVNGLVDGKAYEYYKNGELMSDVSFKMGIEHGSQFKFNQDGTPKFSCTMNNGKMEGEAIWYNDDGTILCKATFVNGKKNGVQPFYGDDGTVVKEEYWENGVFVREELK